ncbi:hypothetical protein D3C81_1944780 [compost metagenome]
MVEEFLVGLHQLLVGNPQTGAIDAFVEEFAQGQAGRKVAVDDFHVGDGLDELGAEHGITVDAFAHEEAAGCQSE